MKSHGLALSRGKWSNHDVSFCDQTINFGTVGNSSDGNDPVPYACRLPRMLLISLHQVESFWTGSGLGVMRQRRRSISGLHSCKELAL
jgi:hypothetical protein